MGILTASEGGERSTGSRGVQSGREHVEVDGDEVSRRPRQNKEVPGEERRGRGVESGKAGR